VEFIDLDEAWADLRRQGVVKVVDSPKELRLELDGDAAVVMDIATEDHPEVGDLPATIRRVPRGAVANFVEAIVHKMHLQQTYAIPVGRWREIFDAVSDGMAGNAAWREVDTSASIEMNKRDPSNWLVRMERSARCALPTAPISNTPATVPRHSANGFVRF